MKKNQLLLLVYVVACGFTSNLYADSDKFKTHSGTECERTYDRDQDLSLSMEADPVTGDRKLMLTYTIEFGGGFKSQRLDCRTTMRYEEDRMYLENERLKLELELLRRKVDGDKNAGQTAAASTNTDGDDW